MIQVFMALLRAQVAQGNAKPLGRLPYFGGGAPPVPAGALLDDIAPALAAPDAADPGGVGPFATLSDAAGAAAGVVSAFF
jgi:hypothetical protein